MIVLSLPGRLTITLQIVLCRFSLKLVEGERMGMKGLPQ